MGQLYHKNLTLMNAEAICYCWTILNVTQPSYGWTRSLFVPDLSHGGLPVAASNQLRVFGAYSRRIRRGMTRLGLQCGDKDLLATAFAGPEGATLVLLNRGPTPCRADIRGLSGWKELELADPYHENTVQPAPGRGAGGPRFAGYPNHRPARPPAGELVATASAPASG